MIDYIYTSEKLKPTEKTNMESGLRISEKAKYGVYVPIAIDPNQHEEKLDQLKSIVKNINSTQHLEIEVMEIRAWKLESASKAKEVSDTSRYYP